MKLRFHVIPGNDDFHLKASPSETVRDLKEKVQNRKRIPIYRQNFQYMGDDLLDDRTVRDCYLYHNALVIIQRGPELFPVPVSHSHVLPQTLPPPPSTVTLNVKVPRSQDRIPFEMDKDETILHLKVKIAARQDMGGVPVERIVLLSPLVRAEWHNDQVLQHIPFSGSCDIDVSLKPLAAATSSSSSSRLAQP